jgi:serine/threonine-protein phosphatase PP1 catalytic subunit
VISERIFCVHGGLSQQLKSLRDIEKLQRPLDIPSHGLLADLLWSDPDPSHSGYAPSDRGTSHTFGLDVVEDFMRTFDFDLICRAHQVVSEGFEFPFHPNQSILTVFSARNYCDEFGNKGAILKVDANLRCSFDALDPPNGAIEPIRPVTGRRKIID